MNIQKSFRRELNKFQNELCLRENEQNSSENRDFMDLGVSKENSEESREHGFTSEMKSLSCDLETSEFDSNRIGKPLKDLKTLIPLKSDKSGRYNLFIDDNQLRGGGNETEAFNGPTEEAQSDQIAASLYFKIEEYKEKIKSNSNLERELEFYIKPLGKLKVELEYEIQKRLLNPDSELKVLLLSGEAGIGKSLFCKYLQRAILFEWENQFGELDERYWLPIFVDLSDFKRSQQFSSPISMNFTISEVLRQELLFSESEIEFIRSSGPAMLRLPYFLFIFDEYDQLLQNPAKPFNQWSTDDYIEHNAWGYGGCEVHRDRMKMIITARSETLVNLPCKELLFGRLDKSTRAPIQNSFSEFEVKPLSELQISSYLKKYIVSNSQLDFCEILSEPEYTKSWGLVKEIENIIRSYGLRYLVRLPMNLVIFSKILSDFLIQQDKIRAGSSSLSDSTRQKGSLSRQEMSKGNQDKSASNCLTRFRIYQLFVHQTIKATIRRVLTSNEGEIANEKSLYQNEDNLFDKLNQKLLSLALSSSDYLPDREITRYEREEEEDVEPLLRLCPLLKTIEKRPGSPYKFIHKSVQAFFIAKNIKEAIINHFHEKEPIDPHKMLLNQIPINTGSLSIFILQFLVDAVNNRLISSSALIKLILASRINDLKSNLQREDQIEFDNPDSEDNNFHHHYDFSIAAANAITILNASGYDFSNMDLSGIRIAGAQLSNGIFEGTNFTGANLQGVNFSGAWLKDAKLEHANLKDVNFGVIPDLKIDKEVLSVAHSPSGTYMAIGVRNEEIIVFERSEGQTPFFKEMRRFKGHRGEITNCSFSKDCKFLITCGNDKTARMWDLEMGKCVKILSEVIKCEFSQDGKQIVSIDEAKIDKKWIASAGDLNPLHERKVKSETICGFIPKYERIMYVGNKEHSPSLYHSATGKYIRRLTFKQKWISAELDIFPEPVIVSWDSSPPVGLSDLHVSPDGKQVAVGVHDEVMHLRINNSGTIAVLDYVRGHHIKSLKHYAINEIYSMDSRYLLKTLFSPCGTKMITTLGSSLKVQDIASGMGQKKNLKNIISCYAIDPVYQNQIVTFTNANNATFSEFLTLNHGQRANVLKGVNKKGLNLTGVNIDGSKGLSDLNITIFDERGDYRGMGIGQIKELILNNQTSSTEKITAIDLSSRGLSTEGARIIGRHLKWVNLQRLDMSQNMIGVKGATVISCNSSWKSLRKLDLSSNKLEDEGARALARNGAWPLLEELDLSKNIIGIIGATAIGENTLWTNLRVLSLEINKISDAGALAIAKNKVWLNLEELYLYNNMISEKFSEEMKTMNIWSKIKILICYVENPNFSNICSVRDEIENRNFGRDLRMSICKFYKNRGDSSAIAIGRTKGLIDLKEIQLQDYLIREKGAISIGSNKNWSALEELNLSMNRIGDGGAIAIGSNLTWTNLKRLYLNNNKIGDSGAISIGNNNVWTGLRELTLDRNIIGSEGAVAIGSNTTWANLKKLKLSKNRIGDEGAVAIASNITWTGLDFLSLSDNNIGDRGAAAIGNNTSWRNLIILKLNTNRIGDQGAIAIGNNTSWSNLKKLILNANQIGDKGAVALESNTTWSCLESLYLREIEITDHIYNNPSRNTGEKIKETFQKLIFIAKAHIKKPEPLVLSNRALTDKDIAAYIDRMAVTTEALNVSHNKIGEQGVRCIVGNKKSKNLKKLFLSSNRIFDKGAEAIGENNSCRKLLELDVSLNQIGNKGVFSLSKASSLNCLTNLNLSMNKIGDEGAIAIGKNISWTNLKVLDLHDNVIGNNGAIGIGNNVSWKKLLKLDLSYNIIGDEGAVAIGANVVWTQLTMLNLQENEVGTTGILAIRNSVILGQIKELHLRFQRERFVSSVAKPSNPKWIDLEMSHSSDDEIKYKSEVSLKRSSIWDRFGCLFSKRNQIGDEEHLLTGKKIGANEVEGTKQHQMQEDSVRLEIDDSINDLKISKSRKRNGLMKILCACFETIFQKQYKRMN